MSKKYYRFFGGLLKAQENWLNKMSEKGYRLIRTGRMLYEFEECKPNQYTAWNLSDKNRKMEQKIITSFLKIWATRFFTKIST